MESRMNKKSIQISSLLIVLLISNTYLFAYPPDNAAVLYYRSSYTLTKDSEKADQVRKYIKGEIKINQEIIDYVLSNEYAMKQFIDAGKGKYCDWGYDYSQGMNMQAPPLAAFRNLTEIVLADAKMAIEAGEYDRAIDLCMGTYKAGSYIAEGSLIVSRLVGIAIDAYINQHIIIEILPNIEDNPEMLVQLKNQIYEISQEFPSLKTTIKTDLEICFGDINKENVNNLIETGGVQIPENVRQIIQNADEEFFEFNKEYLFNLLNDCISATDLPYPQAHEKLDELIKKPEIDSKENPNAILSTILMPALSKVLSLDIRHKTHFNAIQIALNFYIDKAKTGKLPNELPEGMPKDMFSGKDFIYEKTSSGFVLKCQGMDLPKGEKYEYKFKIK